MLINDDFPLSFLQVIPKLLLRILSALLHLSRTSQEVSASANLLLEVDYLEVSLLRLVSLFLSFSFNRFICCL